MTTQTDKWKAEPLPYCVTRYDPDRLCGVPFGKRRFATVDEASAFAIRNNACSRWPLMVDFASAYRRVASGAFVGGARQVGDHRRVASAEPRAVLETSAV